ADRDVLGDHGAFDLGAIADQKVGGVHLAFDPAEHLRRTVAFDVADDRHAAADARDRAGLRVRLRPCRSPFNDGSLRRYYRRDDRRCVRRLVFEWLAVESLTLEHGYPLPFNALTPPSAHLAGRPPGPAGPLARFSVP